MDEGIEELGDQALRREIRKANNKVTYWNGRLRALIKEARKRKVPQGEIGKLMGGISQSAVSQREKVIRQPPPTE